LPVVLYGCETWSVTLRGNHRFRVFEDRLLWRIFGPKLEETTGSGEDYMMSSLMIGFDRKRHWKETTLKT
jgi:hypothetical protein